MSRKNIKNQKLIMDRIIIRPKTRCWIWTENIENVGYGIIKINSKNYKAHRVSYEVFNGPIPDGLFCLHRCDVRSCCNPEHLFLGTDQDNSDDKVNKNRHLKGEEMSLSKLKNYQILEIRQKYATGNYTQQELGDQYLVGNDLISRIVNYKRWRHI